MTHKLFRQWFDRSNGNKSDWVAVVYTLRRWPSSRPAIRGGILTHIYRRITKNWSKFCSILDHQSTIAGHSLTDCTRCPQLSSLSSSGWAKLRSVGRRQKLPRVQLTSKFSAKISSQESLSGVYLFSLALPITRYYMQRSALVFRSFRSRIPRIPCGVFEWPNTVLLWWSTQMCSICPPGFIFKPNVYRLWGVKFWWKINHTNFWGLNILFIKILTHILTQIWERFPKLQRQNWIYEKSNNGPIFYFKIEIMTKKYFRKCEFIYYLCIKISEIWEKSKLRNLSNRLILINGTNNTIIEKIFHIFYASFYNCYPFIWIQSIFISSLSFVCHLINFLRIYYNYS